MKLIHTFKGLLTGEERTIDNFDMVSPNGGYTQSYIDRAGKDYELGRAEELLGSSDIWVWVESSKA